MWFLVLGSCIYSLWADMLPIGVIIGLPLAVLFFVLVFLPSVVLFRMFVRALLATELPTEKVALVSVACSALVVAVGVTALLAMINQWHVSVFFVGFLTVIPSVIATLVAWLVFDVSKEPTLP